MSPSKRLIRVTGFAVAFILSVGVAPPVASAELVTPRQTSSVERARVPALPLGVQRTASGANPAAPSAVSITPAGVGIASSGFDWGDAGIGAGAGLVVSMIVVGGVLARTSRREQPSPRSS
jgi:hypothetical protein